MPNYMEIVEWIRAGSIGRITAVELSRGIEHEIAGGACPDIVMIRHIIDQEVKWVEGWALPEQRNWDFPDEAKPEERDGPMYGRFGFDDDLVCEIPKPSEGVGRISIHGENGHVFLNGRCPALVQSTGHNARLITPKFLEADADWHYIPGAVARVVEAFDTRQTPPCNGHDYRQALEIAIAMKLSDKNDHQRIDLPLADRSGRVFPEPYRYHGGDGLDLDSHTDMKRIERELHRWPHG